VDGGIPPPIIPLAAWLASWPPDSAVIERVERAEATVSERRNEKN
jgi:hypothetical protein